jgi:uncharacterized protein with ATP-grasp and redox domains
VKKGEKEKIIYISEPIQNISDKKYIRSMDKKRHIIRNFLKFVSEKYSQDEEEKEPKLDYKSEYEKIVGEEDEDLSKKKLEDDLIDIIEEFKMKYER